MPESTPVRLRIVGSDLPGRTCAAGPDFSGAHNVHVAVQRKDNPRELLDLQPGDAPSATWTLECTAVTTPDGIVLDGRHVHNRLGGRFVYLSWGEVDEGSGSFEMFRRAKLMFDAIGPDVMAAAVESGQLTARLRLTDAKGHPICASVRPPLIEWSGRADSDG